MSVDVGQMLCGCADNLVRKQQICLSCSRPARGGAVRKGEEGRPPGGKGGKNDLAGNNNSNP